MGRCLLGLALLAGACQARLADDTMETGDANTGIDGPVTIDAEPDALVLGAWGTPTKVGGASTTNLAEDDGSLSSSTLEIVFAVGTATGKDLYYASRMTPTAAWSPPALLGLNTTTASEETPRFSADDLTLYFASDRVAGNNLDIYRVSRSAVGSTWGMPAIVTGPNTPSLEKWFTPCGGNRYMVIQGGDIAQGTLGAGAPTVVASLSAVAPANETGTFLTQDCLTVYFASTRSTPTGLFKSTRMTNTDPWPAPTPVTDYMAIGGNQEDPWLAPDQRTFMFVSDVSGTKDVYISVR